MTRGERDITLDRLEQLVVDADLGKPRKGYTAAELRMRDKLDVEIAEIKARGHSVEIPFGLPNLD